MKRCLPQCAVRHTSLGESRHHWQRQHHLPKANIIEKRRLLSQSSFFLAGAGGLGLVATTQSRVFDFGFATRLRSSAALTVHWTVIHYRSPSSPPQIVSQQKEKAHEKSWTLSFWQGREDSNPRPTVLEWLKSITKP